jgi:hypothetical protein
MNAMTMSGIDLSDISVPLFQLASMSSTEAFLPCGACRCNGRKVAKRLDGSQPILIPDPPSRP